MKKKKQMKPKSPKSSCGSIMMSWSLTTTISCNWLLLTLDFKSLQKAGNNSEQSQHTECKLLSAWEQKIHTTEAGRLRFSYYTTTTLPK